MKERFLKILVVVVYGSVFAVLLPLLLIYIGEKLQEVCQIDLPEILRGVIGALCILLGGSFLISSLIAHIKIGKGTPVPLLPSKKLIVKGPYKVSRNPMQLGWMLYFLGVGTLLSSLTTGLLGFVVAFTFGTLYNKYIEEKELLKRFGAEYQEYKRSTPFLIPKLRRKK